MNNLKTLIDVLMLLAGILILAGCMTLVLLPKSRVVYDFRRKKDVHRNK